jgi:hypothetical protein
MLIISQHIPCDFKRKASHLSQMASWTGPPMIRPLAVRLGSPSRTKKRPSAPNPLPHSWQAKHCSCHCPPIAVTTTSSRTCCLQPRQRGAVRRPWHLRHQAKPSFSTKGVFESKGCNNNQNTGVKCMREGSQNLHHHTRRRRSDRHAIPHHRQRPLLPQWVSCNSCSAG